MNYELCLYVMSVSIIISAIMGIVVMKVRHKTGKRKAVIFCKWLRLSFVTSAITAAIICLIMSVSRRKSDDNTAISIKSLQQDPYYTRIDPSDFPKTHMEEKTSDPTDESASEEGDMEGEETVQSTATPRETNQPSENYDYSMLEIFGKYQFGNLITADDLNEMRSMYQEYWENEKYWIMLGEAGDGTEKTEELEKRIQEFDDRVQSGDEITASEHFQNAQDRLLCYGRKDENISFLEQSAISAENAAECEDVKNSGGYDNLFQYIRAGIVRFSCFLGSGDKLLCNGREADIKFQMGKMMCKPARNLEQITRSGKYYSLCSAYVILKDAFDHSSLDSNYAVEVAYYYMLICNDIVKVMDPEQSGEMKNRIKLAYYQFYERVKEKPDNLYDSYCRQAETIMENLEMQR